MPTIRLPAQRRWLIRLLIGLLVLAPYLHCHVGSSTQAGLHMADMHTVATDAANPAGQDPESLALGVSPSLPQLGIDLLGLVTCVLILGLLLRRREPERPARPHAPIGCQTLYGLGWPPPSLAPPRA